MSGEMVLPPSTLEVVAHHAAGANAPHLIVQWADQLTTGGVDHPAIIELALTDPANWETVRKITPLALEAVGLPVDPVEAERWVLDRLVDSLRDEAIDVYEAARHGYRLYCQLGDSDVLIGFASLEDYLLLFRDGVVQGPSQSGLRDWAAAYVRGEAKGPFESR
jgi:hypothetical protein